MTSRHVEPVGLLLKRCAIATLLALGLTACASTSTTDSDEQQASANATAERNADPFEGLNRAIFAFNRKIDSWFLKPVAKGYKVVTPRPVQIGVGNFFSNLAEITNVANDVLQWKWGQAGNDSGRFLINSTLGVAGLFDVASKAGLPESDGEDFGQTLGAWGVGPGPYLMVPFLGPATIRDGSGLFADYYTSPIRFVDPDTAEYAVHAVNFVDQRAQVLETESLITGDSYLLLRDYYLQRRKFLVNDGEVADDFGGDDFGDYGDYENYDDYD